MTSHEERHGRAVRKLYVATDLGREALEIARGKAHELFGELVEGHGRERRPGNDTA